MILSLLLQGLMAAIATTGFSLLFGVPQRYYPYCGLIGGGCWILYLNLRLIVTAPVATFFTTVAVILISRWFAVRKRCPVTIFLISGIIPLVPGTGVYWASYYTVTGQLDIAGKTGFEAMKIAVAIVLGIIFVFELPQRFFRFGSQPKEGK